MKIKSILVASLLLLVSVKVNAAIIVDTGTGFGAGPVLSENQYYAGLFTLSQQETLTSVEGWIRGRGADGDEMTVAIYSNDLGLPGTPGTELFSATGLLSDAGPCPIGQDCNYEFWRGVYEQDWTLDAGSYWASFEMRTSITGNYAMPEGDLPNPLFAEAVYVGNIDTWELACEIVQNECIGPRSVQTGFRIATEDSILAPTFPIYPDLPPIDPIPPIPVPAALWLFGTALVGLVGFGRRRKAA